MKNILTFLIATVLVSPAFATEIDNIDILEMGSTKGHHGHKNPCHHINFSDDQKSEYKKARAHFMADVEVPKSHLKRAHKNYIATLKNVNEPEAHANHYAHQMHKWGVRLNHLRRQFFHSIVYDIATAEQRKPLLHCIHHMKKHGKNHPPKGNKEEKENLPSPNPA